MRTFYDIPHSVARSEEAISFLFTETRYTCVVPRFSYFLLFSIFSSCVFAQIELPFIEEDPEGQPTVTPEEQAEEQQRIRTITRKIVTRSQAPVQELDVRQHPGQERYKRVYARLEEAPPLVHAKVTTRKDEVITGYLQNRFLDVSTSVGTFPVLWSEMVSVDVSPEKVIISLMKGDALTGDLGLEEVTVEKDDTSFVSIPFENVKYVQVSEKR